MLELICREALHRWRTLILGALVLGCAVASVFLFGFLTTEVERETRKVQRDIGLNVVILPEATDEGRYWSLGYSEHSMPASYIDKLESQEVANRLIPLLRRRVTLGTLEVMLTGIAPERFKGGKQMKPVFGRDLPPDQVVVGSTVARVLELEEGDTFEVLGQEVRLQRVLGGGGTEEDVVIYAALESVQSMLGLEGRINEIQALECHCEADVEDPLQVLRAELEPLLPGTRILRRSAAADARRSQRLLAENMIEFATPLILLLAGLLTAVLSLLNLRERRREFAVLSALGKSRGLLASLVLGRALVVGLLGSLLGSVAGYLLCVEVGESIFQLPASKVALDPGFYLKLVMGAPLFAALASPPPALFGARLDPVGVLEHE